MPAPLIGRVALGLTLVLSAPAAAVAAPAVTATLRVKDAAGTQTGALQFDLGSGPVRGLVEIAVAADPGNLPQLQQGGGAAGRFAARLDLGGLYHGGLYGSLTGTAKLGGTFTTDGGCQARLQGDGTMEGSVNGPTGLAGVTVTFAALRFEGCGLLSPQAFVTALPPFAFTPTDTPPTPTGAFTLQQPIAAPVRQAGPTVARTTPGAVEGRPADPLARGQALLRDERFAEAQQAFDEALARGPAVEALVGRGQARSMLGDAAGALHDFEAALRANPRLPDARVWMAELWLATGDYERARQALADELALVPGSPWARSYLGTLQLLTNRVAEARGTLADVARADPGAARRRYARGVALTAQGQPRRAAIEFTSVLGFEPPIAAAYFGLGLALSQLNQHADAIRMLEHYVALEPSTPLAARARQEIGRLKTALPR